MNYFIYFFMGIGLSMDAFSIALSIGITKPSKMLIIIESICTGIFHFVMPLLGSLISFRIIKNTNLIVSLVFLILGIEMYKSKDDDKKIIIKNILTILLISFTVSIDSLIVGVALNMDGDNLKLASIIFAVISCIFTFVGLNMGIKLKEKYSDKANILGSIILFVISLKYLIG